MRLESKVALVTGGGSGIGRATVVLFAREGARIADADLNADDAQRTADEIAIAGGYAVTAVGDVSKSGDAKTMVDAALGANGKLDILVNSAGVSPRNATAPDASPGGDLGSGAGYQPEGHVSGQLARRAADAARWRRFDHQSGVNHCGRGLLIGYSERDGRIQSLTRLPTTGSFSSPATWRWPMPARTSGLIAIALVMSSPI